MDIVHAVKHVKQEFAHCLTPHSIERACRAENHVWRQRELGPTETIHAFLLQVLNGNTACTHVVRLANLNCSAEAYCQARARLPLSVYERVLAQTVEMARRSAHAPTWRGHRTFLVDSSSFSMADTDELRAHFGQPPGQRAGCGFPTAYWLTLFDAETGLLIKQLAAPLHTHDMSQVSKMHPALTAGDVLVGDRAFASYAHWALLSRQNVHGLLRAHQRMLISFRKDRKLVGKQSAGVTASRANSRLIRKLGKYDQLVEYARPKTRPEWIDEKTYRQLPDTMIVRELQIHIKLRTRRTRTVRLVTTLLDPEKYPAEALAALYQQRCEIETNLGYLKTTMGMDVLRCRSVPGILKEMTVYALVYNLVRLVMLRASERQQVKPSTISFIDAYRWLAQACWHSQPLRLIVNPRRPNRYHPRVRKRRPKQYPLLKRPRDQLPQTPATKQPAH